MLFRKSFLSVFIIFMLFVLPLSSCSISASDPLEILEQIKKSEAQLPAGNTYYSLAKEGEDGYIPPSLALDLFGEDTQGALSLVESCGVFVASGKLPSEFFVFRCYAASDTLDVATLCHARLDILRGYYNGTELSAYTDNARVMICGKYVVLALSKDADSALLAAKKAI